jgi:hypothetical protein
VIDLITTQIHIVSVANMREHWRVKHARAKQHRSTAAHLIRAALATNPVTAWPIVVTMTRLGTRAMDDDNLAGGFKATRDGIADALGIDDGGPMVKWIPAQFVSKGPTGVRIAFSQGEFVPPTVTRTRDSQGLSPARQSRSIRAEGNTNG